MAEGLVQVAPDSTGKKIRTQEVIEGANSVEQQVVTIANADGTLVDATTTQVSNFPADQLVHATNLDVAISTLLNAADTLTKVATVDTITNPVAVTGTFFQATQPVSGSVSLAGEALESLRTQRTMIGRASLRPKADKLRRMGLHA